MKERTKKRLFLFDIVFTIFILIWVIRTFIEGDVSKGIIFSGLLLIMVGLLVFNRKR